MKNKIISFLMALTLAFFPFASIVPAYAATAPEGAISDVGPQTVYVFEKEVESDDLTTIQDYWVGSNQTISVHVNPVGSTQHKIIAAYLIDVETGTELTWDAMWADIGTGINISAQGEGKYIRLVALNGTTDVVTIKGQTTIN